MLYRIGFDIGVASVGWAVLENDPLTEEPCRIVKLGVKAFSANEKDDTGQSTATERREKRGLRRRTKRKNFRIFRMKKLLSATFGFSIDKELAELFNEDVYKLRAKAIDEKVSEAELSKIILNILKHRGFKSNRKSDAEKKKEGKLLKSLADNKKFLEEKNYRTIGEAIFKDERFKQTSCGRDIYNVRNHDDDYRNCFSREDLKNELMLILKKQQEFDDRITDEFIERVISIFEAQRNFDDGPGEPSPYSAKFEVGMCTLIPTELRAPKSSYTFEYFNALSKINSLRINDEPLTDTERETLIGNVKERESLKFTDVRKLLSVPYDKIFNLCDYRSKKVKTTEADSEETKIKLYEGAEFVSMKNSYSVKNALNLDSSYQNRELIDDITTLLSTCKSDSVIDANFEKYETLKALSDTDKEKIKALDFNKFGSLSYKAMRSIIPYLEQGQRYDEACKSAGFNHSEFVCDKMKYLKGKQISEELSDITSPVVKRSVNQTLNILNSIIKKYGSPQMVNIELARDLSKSAKDRKRIKKQQEENFIINERVKEQLRNEFNVPYPKPLDILKKKLYDEQGGKCMYSGRSLDLQRILTDYNYVQIDHILPYSRSLDDSYNNKVLVLSSENQNKGNKTPFEYFGKDEKRWNSFVAQVNLLQNKTKKKNLLKENFGQEQEKEFTSRNLNDTRYMSKFLLNLMQKYLLMTPSQKHKILIRSVSGGITSYLRKFWGISKIRDDGDIHHCVDAAVIATVSASTIKRVTDFNKINEKYEFAEKYKKFIDRETGVALSEEELVRQNISGIDLFSRRLPPPYPGFVKELEIRSTVKYKDFYFTDEEKLELKRLGYEDEEISAAKPVFISRMKTVKMTGAIHKDTIMSDREYDKTKNLIKSVSITELTLKQNPEPEPLSGDKYPGYVIEDYYRPQDDRLLYLKLKQCLVENGKIDETVPFYKPKSDGTDGPIVKKVKIYNKATSIVKTGTGAALNDNMHRVDVFKKGNKYYLCPVYNSDVYAKKLPNKLVVQGKDWIDIDDSFEFQFSLYKNDLIMITSKKPMVMSKVNKDNPESKKPDTFENDKLLVYYIGMNISNESFSLITHDECYQKRLGVKTLLNIEKMYVDNMGNIYHAPKEERKGL